MPQPLESRARYMPGLDGLRAVAVLAVIAYHLNLGWAPGGLLGVAVFFVLSGYLITDLLLGQRERYGQIRLGEFWKRRARRLLPALWVMLAVVVLWVSFGKPSQLASLRGDVVAALLYVSNWWYALQHVSYFASFGPPSPLGHLWSLAVEEQFYVVWPLLLVAGALLLGPRPSMDGPLVLRLRAATLLRPLLPVVLVLLAAVVSATLMALVYHPGADPDRVYYGTDTRAFELLFGAALAFVWPSRRLRNNLSFSRRAALELAGLAGLVVIAVLFAVTDEYHPFIYRGGLVLLSLATVAVIAALVHPATALGRALGVAPLRWLGVRSYGIYLWHYPVIVLTTPLVDTAGPHLARDLLQIGATLAIAALSWRFIEEPIRRQGFGAQFAWLRTARWNMARQPAAVYESMAASVLLIGASGLGIVGLAMPGTTTAAQQPQFTASGDSVAALSDVSAGACVQPAPVPLVAPVPPPAPQPPPSGDDVTAVGDSIMVDLDPYLSDDLPGITVDGAVSRQMYQLGDTLNAMRAQGRLHLRLVIELGTNGPFDESYVTSTLQSLGPMQRIVLVNAREPRPWEQSVNQSLADVARQVPHTVVADWYGASAGHPEYFWDDGVHPDSTGAPIEAGLIVKALGPSHPAPPVSRAPGSIHVMRCAWW
jgi:peptidoglycan/LPS O-acetylase OafA/YrhL